MTILKGTPARSAGWRTGCCGTQAGNGVSSVHPQGAQGECGPLPRATRARAQVRIEIWVRRGPGVDSSAGHLWPVVEVRGIKLEVYGEERRRTRAGGHRGRGSAQCDVSC